MKTDEKQSVSPEEMVRAALEKAEKDEWNCLITRLGREETDNRLAEVLVRPEPGRLSGIPIVVKDNICTKGSERPADQRCWSILSRDTRQLLWNDWNGRELF